MKRIVAMLCLVVIAFSSVGAISIKAETTTIEEVTTSTDDEDTSTQYGTVYVRVTKDNVSVREEPFPWKSKILTANTGDTFKYMGHYLGYYIVDINDDKYCGYIYDGYAETYVVYENEE